MNLAYNYQLIPDLRKVKDMERFIAGSYWENDVWNLNDPFWDDYSIGKKSFTSRRITFFEYPHLFRLEMKYYLATRLLRKTLNPSSLWSDYQFMLKKFVCFLQEAYPQINSFSEISIDEMVPAWLNYVALSGRKSSRQGYRAQIYQLYLFFSDFYDTRDEYEKDIWDCRKIPSVDIPVHAVNHLINFTFIPAAFQRLAKKYIKTRLVIVADGLFCREIDGLFCRSSPDIIVRRRCVLSHKRRGWLQPSPSFRYSRNLALQDELYHPVINNGPAVLVCVDKRLGTGPVNQSRDAG